MAKKKKISSKQATANKWAAVIGTLNSNQQNAIVGNSPFPPFPPFPNSGLTNSSFNLLPIAIKVAARTIGLDLVSVKPMSTPNGVIWGDYKYGYDFLAEQKRKERREKMEEIFAEELKIINEENKK